MVLKQRYLPVMTRLQSLRKWRSVDIDFGGFLVMIMTHVYTACSSRTFLREMNLNFWVIQIYFAECWRPYELLNSPGIDEQPS